MNPHLARIRLYPVKSLDPLEVDEVVVLRDAGLAHDREFCLLDENGDVVNGKRFGEQLISIRSEVDLGLGELTLHANGTSQVFRLASESGAIESWFSSRLGRPVTLARNSQGGFPDDSACPRTHARQHRDSAGGGLLVSGICRPAKCGAASAPIWRSRELPAFWEDRLYGS